jgi:hypothetical protein
MVICLDVWWWRQYVRTIFQRLAGRLARADDSLLTFDCKRWAIWWCHICALPGWCAGALAWWYRDVLSLFVWWRCAGAAIMMRSGTMRNLEALTALFSEVQYHWRHDRMPSMHTIDNNAINDIIKNTSLILLFTGLTILCWYTRLLRVPGKLLFVSGGSRLAAVMELRGKCSLLSEVVTQIGYL